MDPACRLKNKNKTKNNPGLRNQVHEETSRHLLLGAQDQRLGAEQINFLVGPQEPRLATAKRRKLAWFGHVKLRGTFEGGRRRGRQRKCWMDNINEWTSLPMPELLAMAFCRNK